MRKAWFFKEKSATIFAVLALVGVGLLLTPLTVYAQSESMGCSDEVTLKLTSPGPVPEGVGCSDDVTLKLTSPQSNFTPIVIGGVIGIIAIGLALAFRRNRVKAKHKYSS